MSPSKCKTLEMCVVAFKCVFIQAAISLFSEVPKPWVSNPDAEVAAMFVGGNTQNWTCHFSLFETLCAFSVSLTVIYS